MKFEISNVTINNRSKYTESIPLTPGSYAIEIYAKRKSGLGLFSVNLKSNNIIVFSENITSSNSITKNKFIFSLKNNNVIISLNTNFPGKIDICRVRLTKVSKAESFDISKKIAFVIPYSIYGGAEVYIKNILEMLSGSGIVVDILYIQKNALENILNFDFVRHIKCYNFANFKSNILSNNYDCIFYYNSMQVYNQIKESNVISNSKVIEICHSDLLWSDSINNIETNRTYDVAIKVSNSICKNINEYALFPPIINCERFKPSKKPVGRTIGTVARFSSEKNLFYILELAKKMPKYKFEIVGDGNLKRYFLQKVSELNLNNVIVHNFCLDVEKHYNKFDLFLLPSNVEGLPITILEAMSCNIPVLATDVGGVGELIEKGLIYKLHKDISKDIALIPKIIGKTTDTRGYILENHSYDNINAFKELLSEKMISVRDRYQFESILEAYIV